MLLSPTKVLRLDHFSAKIWKADQDLSGGRAFFTDVCIHKDRATRQLLQQMADEGDLGAASKTPADFLKSIKGKAVVVKLNFGVDYRGGRWVDG